MNRRKSRSWAVQPTFLPHLYYLIVYAMEKSKSRGTQKVSKLLHILVEITKARLGNARNRLDDYSKDEERCAGISARDSSSPISRYTGRVRLSNENRIPRAQREVKVEGNLCLNKWPPPHSGYRHFSPFIECCKEKHFFAYAKWKGCNKISVGPKLRLSFLRLLDIVNKLDFSRRF